MRTASPARLFGLALFLGLLAGGPLAADEATDQKLFDARHLLYVLHDPEQALLLYDDVLRQADLDPRSRAEALWGAGECHAARKNWQQAFAAWTTLRDDASLPEKARDRARAAIEEHAAHAPTPPDGVGGAEESPKDLERRRERVRQQVLQLLDRARAAMAARKYEDARREVTGALALDPENPEALRLADDVERQQPDRGAMVRTLLRFYETIRSEGFQRLRQAMSMLEDEGQRLRAQGQLQEAGLAFRRAIALVDRSEFGSELDAERWNLVFWFRQVASEARAKGIDLGPEPVRASAPPPEAGLRGRFYALLSESFSERGDGATDPIRFHEFAPLPPADGALGRALGPNAFASARIGVEQGPGTLTRARFAERFVRATIPDWPSRETNLPRPATVRKPGAAPSTRFLERLDDVLFVQHTEAVQREIDGLRRAFAERPPPLQVDVLVFAAGPGGTARIATALRLPAPPARASGLDAVVEDRLIEECREDLSLLQNVTLLGGAQLRLSGAVGARLDVLERTEAHPLHASLPKPPLTLLDPAAARYGLSLDVYGEDLPGQRKPPRASAVSLVARTRVPLPSVVVRKAGEGDDAWRRLPKFAETGAEADRRLAHASTLVLFGLPNPFLDSAATFPDLVLLVGTRPAAESGQAPRPDPPPWQAPDRTEAQEHPIGPLATEVLDDLVIDGWPLDRSAAAPVAEGVAREARDQYLAALLASRARLVAPGAPNVVRVRDGLAEAAVGPQEHVRLQAAVAWLAAQQDALVEVQARAYDVPRELADGALARAAAVPLPAGEAWVVPLAALAPLDQELAHGAAAGAFALDSAQTARVTQQVVVRRLHTRGITRQVRVLRGAADEPARLVPVPGLAEEGLVLQVRAGPDEDGRRVTTVRVRAAQLRAIESVPVPGIEPRRASVDVPRWHPLRDRSAAAPLADGEPLWVRVDHPSEPGRVLLVRVVTTRLP